MARVSKKTQTPKIAYCNSCRREYTIDKFYETKNPLHKSGVTLFCRDCCEEITRYYLKQTSQLESSMWFTCSFIGVPFIRSVFEAFEKKISSYQEKTGKKFEEYNLFGNYYSCLTKYQSKTDDWKDFTDTDVGLGDIQTLKTSEELIRQELERFEFDWGKQTAEDYQFLEYTFNKYIENIDFVNPQQKDLYRDLCLARLQKRKIEAGTQDISESMKDVQNRILTLMNKLKLDEFESTKTKTLSEQSLFAKIRLCDQNNVEDIYKTPTKHIDFNQYMKYEKDMSLRPLGNMLVGHRDFDIKLEDIEEYNLS